MKKKRLVVLLVGINEYPFSPLHGCENDVKFMCDFLKKHYDDSKYQLDIKCLRNKEATRANFIKVFLEHFKDLESDDQALFYFSGHGSQISAPEGFDKGDQETMLETFVLQDSRLDKGYDLIDKEFRYLVWEVTRKSNVLFTILTDCCFSGGIHRTIEARTRREANAHQLRPWKAFLGAEHYIEAADGQVTVLGGRYVAFAACRDDEEAKEKYIGLDHRGVFTYSLLKALENAKGNLTFPELKKRTQAVVYNEAKKQHPQLDSAIPADEETVFLGGSFLPKVVSHEFVNNRQVQDGLPKGWLIDMGLVHGLEKLSEDEESYLLIFKDDTSIPNWSDPSKSIGKAKLTKVLDTHSMAEIIEGTFPEKYYRAIFINPPIKPMPIGFNHKCDEDGVAVMKKEYVDYNSPHLKLVENWKEAEYFIHVQDGYYWFRRNGELPDGVLEQIRGYNDASANQLLVNLETVAHWHRIQRMKNVESSIGKVRLEFFEVRKVNADFTEVEEELPIDDFPENVTLKYQFVDRGLGEKPDEIDPMFRLKIKNESREKLWFNILYLCANYCISDVFKLEKPLEPGAEDFVEISERDEHGSWFSNILRLHIEKEYMGDEEEFFELTEFVKIIATTQELDVHDLTQDGVPFHNTDRNRAPGASPKMKVPRVDWKTFDFAIKMQYDTSS